MLSKSCFLLWRRNLVLKIWFVRACVCVCAFARCACRLAGRVLRSCVCETQKNRCPRAAFGACVARCASVFRMDLQSMVTAGYRRTRAELRRVRSERALTLSTQFFQSERHFSVVIDFALEINRKTVFSVGLLALKFNRKTPQNSIGIPNKINRNSIKNQ